MLHNEVIMSVWVKICGVNDYHSSLDGADAVGFMFYPRSPRFVTADAAAAIACRLPPEVHRIGVFVDSADDVLEHILSHLPLDGIQLHGYEDEERICHVKKRFGLPVTKAVRVSDSEVIGQAQRDYPSADMLLLDSRGASRQTQQDGAKFNWHWLKEHTINHRWCLAGGITPANLEQAVRESGATRVDVASGVESSAGVKDAKLVKKLLHTAHRL